MARRKTPTFTELELEFMNILWTKGEVKPDDIEKALHEKGRTLTGGSIRNVLAIMREKGYVSRRKQGKAYVYKAKLHEDQARIKTVQYLLSSIFQGSESLLVASLLKNPEISDEEIEKIKLLITDLKQEKPQ